jgi:predicted RNase H-like HicB family nuclease
VFEFRLRVLDVRERASDPPSFLGIVEGFPQVLVHATSVGDAEANLQRALVRYLESLQSLQATRKELDDFPTVRVARLHVATFVG